MTTLRDATTCLLGLGTFLVAATSCAAPPLAGGGGSALRSQVGGYQVEVLVDGAPALTFAHDGETYVLGQLGARYTLRIANRSGRRIEAVVSVDGRDVIDGKPAELRTKRGYLVPAWGQVDIDGWRISRAQAAAFRFSSVPDSYAARTGSAREVGVIGVAVFPERYVPPPPPPIAVPMPRRYDERDGEGEWQGQGEGQGDDLFGGMSDRGAGAAPSSGPGRAAPRSASPPPAPSASASAGEGTAGGPARSEAAKERRRSGLGTEYGEAVRSPIYEVEFVRANPGRPTVVLGLRYNDRDSLLAMGIPVDGPDWAFEREEQLRRTADPFPASQRRYAAPPPGWRGTCCLR
jgi:hypothetical protein